MKIEHDFDFDPEYGYTLEDLLAVEAPEGPEDFAEFWEGAYEKALKIPMNLDVGPAVSPAENVDVFQVYYNSYQGERIGAWLTVPKNVERLECGFVIGHGYGGRDAPIYELPCENAVCIFPCARGFHLSASLNFPGTASAHVLTGIESKETYSHLGSVIDYWLAASALLELYPQVGERLFYHGGSFGGGIGALLLPWDARFKRAYLNIPSFGNHPLRVTLPCTGSGAAVREKYLEEGAKILEVLQYFDAATAAARIQIPVFVAAALFDPSVPPPGQFAIYNAIQSPKQLYLRQAAHFELAGNELDDAAVFARLQRWFR
ncbi:acetylxylan esterase [Puniceicoccus vermicola]|uniref:Acetylxylan esterase n=1 Tax=Puniceicoccus vermicola TaxID=388746 RepID=A0A7X1E2X9_9BACT|nr:acetylxylan esterase [Puniceicoccus vermicola]MBC2600486.1 acetylxylan esterase [Puniceicoccus vermicola]